jgi:hypothetical protein
LRKAFDHKTVLIDEGRLMIDDLGKAFLYFACSTSLLTGGNHQSSFINHLKA